MGGLWSRNQNAETNVVTGADNDIEESISQGLRPQQGRLLIIPCRHHKTCSCYGVDLDRFEKSVDKLHNQVDADISAGKGLVVAAFSISVTFGVALLTFLPALFKPGALDQFCCTPSSSEMICCPRTDPKTSLLPYCCNHANSETLQHTCDGPLAVLPASPLLPRLCNNGSVTGCRIATAAQQYRSRASQVLWAAFVFGCFIVLFLTFKVAEIIFCEDIRRIYKAYLQGSSRLLSWHWYNPSPPTFSLGIIDTFKAFWRSIWRMAVCSYMWLVNGILVVTAYGMSGYYYFKHSGFCGNVDNFSYPGSFHGDALTLIACMFSVPYILGALWMCFRRAYSHDLAALEYTMRNLIGDVNEGDLARDQISLQNRSSWNRERRCFASSKITLAAAGTGAASGATKEREIMEVMSSKLVGNKTSLKSRLGKELAACDGITEEETTPLSLNPLRRDSRRLEDSLVMKESVPPGTMVHGSGPLQKMDLDNSAGSGW